MHIIRLFFKSIASWVNVSAHRSTARQWADSGEQDWMLSTQRCIHALTDHPFMHSAVLCVSLIARLQQQQWRDLQSETRQRRLSHALIPLRDSAGRETSLLTYSLLQSFCCFEEEKITLIVFPETDPKRGFVLVVISHPDQPQKIRNWVIGGFHGVT